MLVYVTVYERPQPEYYSRHYYCSVAFNPARLVDPKGILLCRVRQLPMIVESVLQTVQRYVPLFPDMSAEDIRIKRLDVSCNFYGVTSPSRLLTGLQAVPRRGRRSPHMHSGPSGAQTLTFFVNNTQIAQVSDPYLPGGDVGLIAGSFEDAKVEFYFDNLIVMPAAQ